MNIADIIAEFGAYYLKQGQNMTRLVKLLNIQSVTDSVLTPYYTDETRYQASKARIGRVLQPFQKAWTPIGAAEFVPVAIDMFKQKIDSEEYPDDLEGTWLGFLAGEGIDRKAWPFVRWFVEELLIPQAREDYELFEVYKGVAAAPTAGTAGAAGTAMNGLRKAINDQVTAGRITPIVTGAPNADKALWVDQVEDFADKINTRYMNVPMQLCMNEDLVRRFLRGYEKKYGRNTDYKGESGKVNLSNLTILGLPSMQGSTKIFCTPKANALKLNKKTQNMDKVMIESVDRKVKMFSDWWSGVGFLIPEIVFTNDQDLAGV